MDLLTLAQSVLASGCPTVADVVAGAVSITVPEVVLLRPRRDGRWEALGPYKAAEIEWHRLPPTLRVYVPAV